jgi:hypothetical protein
MKLGFTKTQALHIVKVAIYVAVSTVISYLISLLANDPTLVGPLTPIVNVVLVMLKKFFETPEAK